jgi:Asp-tRNA(Asn)/Glu-tRNA(Gln) amidotransferase A subunit family amidase
MTVPIGDWGFHDFVEVSPIDVETYPEQFLKTISLVLARREAARRAYAMIAHLADGRISPASIGPAPRLDHKGVDSGVVHTTGTPNYNAVTSLLGAPTVTMPLLAVGGLPVGIQVIGHPRRYPPAPPGRG